MVEWFEANVVVPDNSSEPGDYRRHRAAYQAGILQALDDPETEVVVLQKGSQIGYGLMIGGYCGRHIDRDPCPILVVQPTQKAAEKFADEKLQPVIEASPTLKRRVLAPRRGQRGGSTLHKLRYPGGFLQFAWAESPVTLAMSSIRILVLDEPDRYPQSSGGEGNPIEIAWKRTRTWWNRKILIGSTPVDEETSLVAPLFNQTNRQHFYLECHRCAHPQYLTWGQFQWPKGKPELCRYHCEWCGEPWNDAQRWAAIRDGEWRGHAEGQRGWAGFFLPEFYSPWVRNHEMAESYVRAALRLKSGNPEDMKVWKNTVAALPWRNHTNTAPVSQIEARAEGYGAEPLPPGVVLLTAGADCQDDRLEVEICGWGVGQESWSIDYFTLAGDPSRAEVWNQLEEILKHRYQHPSGYTLPVAATCVDSGGHHTQEVYAFCRDRAALRTYAIKGDDGNRPIWPPRASRPKARNRRDAVTSGSLVYIVGVDSAKERLRARLELEIPGPGYCHFPRRHGPEYFEMLGNESKELTRDRKGRERLQWVRSGRNEAWDCRIYAMAALESLISGGVNLERTAAARTQVAAPGRPKNNPGGRRVRSRGIV